MCCPLVSTIPEGPAAATVVPSFNRRGTPAGVTNWADPIWAPWWIPKAALRFLRAGYWMCCPLVSTIPEGPAAATVVPSSADEGLQLVSQTGQIRFGHHGGFQKRHCASYVPGTGCAVRW